MNTSKLRSYLPLHSSTTFDLIIGDFWTATGNPIIKNGKLFLDGSSYLTCDKQWLFAGQDFSIGCRFSATSNTAGGAVCLWQMYIGSSNRFQVSIETNGKLGLWKDSDSTVNILSAGSVLDGQEHYALAVYSSGTWFLFLDGQLVGSKAHTFDSGIYTLYLGRNMYGNRKFTGYIDEFMLFYEALHTENFTPPTDDEFVAAEVELAGYAERSYQFDTAAQIDNVPLLNSATKVWLTADNYPTEDIAGNLWHAYNNPTSNGALQLRGVKQWLAKDGGITLGGKDFTIRGKFNMSSASGWWSRVFEIFNTSGTEADAIRIARYETGSKINCGVFNSAFTCDCTLNVEHDFEFDYLHSEGVVKVFFDGELKGTIEKTIGETTFANCWLGRSNFAADGYFAGTIDEFQIIDGVALHTQDFIPMTVAEIDALKSDFNARYSICFSVQNQIDNAPLTWRYENAGFASLVLPDATTLNNLPATQSKTSVAFYQTAQSKSFNCDPAKTVWIKFDLYHQGGNNFRVFDSSYVQYGAGLYRPSNTRLQLWSNGSAVLNIDNVLATNTLQTWLLRMTSGVDSGAIELWCDDTKVGEYFGNVNNGVDFSNIYLQSDGAKNLFSNVIISNGELTFDDNVPHDVFNVGKTASLERRVHNAPSDDTTCLVFNGSSRNYATVPVDVLGGRTAFTVEIEFSTLDTYTNSTEYGQHAIIGMDIPAAGVGEFNIRINGGNLVVWGSRSNKSVYYFETTTFVSDGLRHKVSVRSNADGSLDTFCDGELILHEDDVNAIISSSHALGIGGDSNGGGCNVAMNFVEGRFWSRALSDDEIFKDLKSARKPVLRTLKSVLRASSNWDEDLEAWYLPTEAGLVDYSSHIRNITVYGTASYAEMHTVFVDVEYLTRNESTRWRYESVALYLGTGDPIYFRLPATKELWMRFDVFFGGGNWRAGEDVLGSFTGIAASPTFALGFYSNGGLVKTLPDIVRDRSTQTFLLHMISDTTDGLIEVWSGLEKLEEHYTGNVNDGRPFYNLALYTDNTKTSFSEFVIGNIPVEPSEKPANAVRVTEMLNVVNCKTTVERIMLPRGGSYPIPFVDITMRDVMRTLVEESEDVGDFVYSPIMSVWCRFKVKFNSTSSWRFYNNDGNGECGIYASAAETNFLSNGVMVKQDSAAGEADQWQTVLIHMDSGEEDGLIEMQTEDGRYFSWSGNVNVAEEFNKFTLMAESGDNVFSDFVIASIPLSLEIKRTTLAAIKYPAFNVRHNGEVITAPLKPSAPQGSLAFSVCWAGSKWYNALVSPNATNATSIVILHSGDLYALSRESS